MTRRGSVVLAFAFAAGLAALAGAASGDEVVSPEWAQNWQDDLRYLARELPRTHPDPFTKLPRDTFEGDVDRLIETVPERSHAEITVELARIVAALGDGHSRVTLPLPDDAGFFLGHSRTPVPRAPGLLFHPLPLRLHYLADGLFVRAVDRGHQRAAGARVLKIGDKTAAEAAALVAPIVHHDNDGQLRFQLPDFLVIPEVLAATGVIESAGAVEITLEGPDGGPFTLRFAPSGDESPELVDSLSIAGASAGVAPPRYLRDPERNFWFDYLPAERAVYFQFNTVYDAEDETLAAFADRLFAFIDEHPVDRLIIDLRWNRGGDHSLSRPLLHGLIASRKLQRPGSLYAIVGGGTFSAAMMFAVDLERHTPVLFVGEPTGSTPNHFGDSRKILLPRTGLTVRISTLHWQLSDPRDDRQAIDPHLPVAVSSADYLSGRDPVLAAVLAPGTTAPAGPDGIAGRWRGRLAHHHTFEFTVDLARAGGGGDGWTGVFDAPDLGVERAALAEISVAGPQVRFVLPDPDAPLVFAGRREGDRIVGALTQRSREIPTLLTVDR